MHFRYHTHFSIKLYLYTNIKLPNKDYLLLITSLSLCLIFQRRIHQRFQSHQMCTISADSKIVQNRDSTVLYLSNSFKRYFLVKVTQYPKKLKFRGWLIEILGVQISFQNFDSTPQSGEIKFVFLFLSVINHTYTYYMFLYVS